jgi:hypothetical protein
MSYATTAYFMNKTTEPTRIREHYVIHGTWDNKLVHVVEYSTE